MNDLVSCLLDSAPIVGNFKSGLELCTGRDAVTNEKLNGVDMVMNGVGLFLPVCKLAKKGSKLKKVVKLVERVEKEYNNHKIKSAVDKIWREYRENEDEDE